jgi:dephospho-CoA kinase
MFRELGAPVIDADEVARDLVEPGTAGLLELAQRFPGVVDATGRLDRAALGQRVFADATERRAGLDEAAITARLAAQLPLADKRAHATWVVDNGGTRDETRAQVRKIWEEIRRSE